MKERNDLTKKKEELQNMMNGECPLGHDFINSHCPVRSAGKIAPNNLDNYVNNLSEEQIDDIFIYHEDCSSFFSC